MKHVHVAVAAVFRGGQVLIARRPDHVHQGGLLEFPGGKVEAGESVQAALVREIDEETGLQVPAASLYPVIGIRHDYGDKRVFLDVWCTSDATGEPAGREGQDVGWMSLDELRDEDFPAANRPIIRALKLPHHLAITGMFGDVLDGLHRLERQLDKHRPPAVLLRAPWLGNSDYADFARGARNLCMEMGCRLILHGDPHRLDRVPADGLHLPWAEAKQLRARPVAKELWLGVSCHSQQELAHAVSIGADYATLGPVQPTASHPGAEPLGWPRYGELVAPVALPVYALGGLQENHTPEARTLGGQGIAGISHWW